MFSIFSFIVNLRICEYPQQNQVRYIKEIISFGSSNPLLAISLSLILFSMAGIPPLAGFFAKVFVILVGVQSSVYSLVLFSIIMSSLACFYYIRIIQSLYFLKSIKWPLFVPMNKKNTFILGTSFFFLLFYFLDIELFSILITKITLTFI